MEPCKAQTGQVGPLIAVDSSDGTLGSANVISVGSNVVFAGDTAKYYRVSAVSETNTGNQTALIRLTESVTSGRAIADNEAGNVTVIGFAGPGGVRGLPRATTMAKIACTSVARPAMAKAKFSFSLLCKNTRQTARLERRMWT